MISKQLIRDPKDHAEAEKKVYIVRFYCRDNVYDGKPYFYEDGVDFYTAFNLVEKERQRFKTEGWETSQIMQYGRYSKGYMMKLWEEFQNGSPGSVCELMFQDTTIEAVEHRKSIPASERI